MNLKAKIYVAGHRGLVGSAIVRCLQNAGFSNLLVRTHAELDLLNQAMVAEFFAAEKPEYLFLAAAKVGGILANNTYPADFLYQNLQIQNNLIYHSYRHGVKKLLFLGSSCIYPRACPQPMKEEYLLTGPLEPTNEPYAIAKIAGIKMCQSYNRQYGTNFIAAMPTNLYGPHDNYDLHNAHVIPMLIHKFYLAASTGAPTVTVWGSGTPRREFLHVDDMAAACLFLMEQVTPTASDNEQGKIFYNIGTGTDLTVRELVEKIKNISGFTGQVVWDANQPDGVPQKLLDSAWLKAKGWQPSIALDDGLKSAYQWFVSQAAKG